MHDLCYVANDTLNLSDGAQLTDGLHHCCKANIHSIDLTPYHCSRYCPFVLCTIHPSNQDMLNHLPSINKQTTPNTQEAMPIPIPQ